MGSEAGKGPEEAPFFPEELKRLGPEDLFVNEFFSSLQGESTYAGWPCFFIRLAGCHLRCTWCDTSHAFFDGFLTSIDECLDRAQEASAPLVAVTGGEPLLQHAVRTLVARLSSAGYKVLLETSGAIGISGIDPRVIRIIDVKCPGSGMAERNLPGIERDLRPSDEIKFVMVDRSDYEWARSWLGERKSRLPRGIPILFSPVFGRLKPDALAAWILEDRLPVRLNLQIHKIIWDPERRGT